MSVLVSTSTFPYREGDGQARFVLDLATALSENTRVTVLAPHAPGARTLEQIGSMSVRRFRYFMPTRWQKLAYGAGMRHNLERSILARVQVPFLLLAETLATAWVSRNEGTDVINAHWIVPQGLSAAVVSRLLNVPLVIHVHAADVYFLKRRRLGRKLARFAIKASTAVLADGSHVRDSLDALIGFSSGARLRPMGVWARQFELADHGHDLTDTPDQYVLFVGRLVEKKGVEYLIRAMVQVRAQRPDMELVIAGDGPLLPELVSLSEQLSISDHVHFVGAQSHENVAALMRSANVICVPSIVDSRGETEGMPTVVLEAMASGARVVGSNVDGIPDVLRDIENGWLVEPADDRSLAEGILTACSDSRGGRIAAEGVETARAHDWLAVASEYRAVLEEAVATTGDGSR